MENFIQKRKFIEFGEYKGCLYGTSKDYNQSSEIQEDLCP